MSDLVSMATPIKSLVDGHGTIDTKHFLFGCELIVLSGNIRSLMADFERCRAALCQHLAISYIRITRGDTSISWEVWCQRFVRKPNGKPLSMPLINRMVKIGLQPDVEAAWNEYRDRMRASAAKSNHSKVSAATARMIRAENENDHLKGVLGPKVVAAVQSLPAPSAMHGKKRKERREKTAQFGVLIAAWEAASEAVREEFLDKIGAVVLP